MDPLLGRGGGTHRPDPSHPRPRDYDRQELHQADAISILDSMAAKGLWAPRRHPISGVKVPRGGAGNVSGRPDLGLVPTDEQVITLIEHLTADQPVYGAMAHVAAYTGIRWGELLALRASVVDSRRRRLTVDLNLCRERPVPSASPRPERPTIPARLAPLSSTPPQSLS